MISPILNIFSPHQSTQSLPSRYITTEARISQPFTQELPKCLCSLSTTTTTSITITIAAKTATAAASCHQEHC
ncbi:hypothetical protein E2C01_066676 [Portunus trituberculatus]|uniref:Uncharacterized protein n=1 Tax=Portunus trituberculatus TaxID=210409 RepID=A0A5B7HM59_PORTR|nr:hypothetical protein [Portunus trituberculatus]